MSATLIWNGLEELKEDLRNLPEELAGDARGIVTRAVQDAAQDVRAIYQSHRHTGNLAEGVRVEPVTSNEAGTSLKLKSTARHAWLFDNGSQARHYTTKSGKQHDTGKMWGRTPPTHVFVHTVIRHRRRMYERLKEMLARHGAKVSGNA